MTVDDRDGNLAELGLHGGEIVMLHLIFLGPGERFGEGGDPVAKIEIAVLVLVVAVGVEILESGGAKHAECLVSRKQAEKGVDGTQ